MSRSLGSPQHEALRFFLIEERKAAGLTQAELAARIGRYQSYVANIETGQRRVDVVELVEIARAIGFDPCKALAAIRD